MFDLSPAVADLQKAWLDLHDVDRADHVQQIMGAGVSGRALARALGCSEALIRYLRVAADASDADKQQARAGALTTRQLVEKAKSRRAELKMLEQAELEKQIQSEGEEAAGLILRWLYDHSLGFGHMEQIVDRANHMLAEKEWEGTLPKGHAPEGMPLEQIIAKCRLEDPEDERDGVMATEKYACWLYLWSFYAFPQLRSAPACISHRRELPGTAQITVE